MPAGTSFLYIKIHCSYVCLRLYIPHTHTHTQLRQDFRSLKRLSSTDGRFKELRGSMRRARPPMVPYLGIVLNEIAGLVEVQPTVIEDNLVNFSKMRRVSFVLNLIHIVS